MLERRFQSWRHCKKPHAQTQKCVTWWRAVCSTLDSVSLRISEKKPRHGTLCFHLRIRAASIECRIHVAGRQQEHSVGNTRPSGLCGATAVRTEALRMQTFKQRTLK
ncbi:hypothetical protein PPTG_21353 [Phytophthora nicotianae INRA-310]|uniref:Uncharacterized protein n=1 Tax=Phytophthora nicotianae (strain INRA-310) TaxID=761204 RepID=W2R7K1_PHYN3|nr:hypothetical protein PPTG_21353 [Phytophthora nicotianae INRA-310]ETN20684.1 hypothetical protein PPTG_21353 [Phytophthora nicotianae INRA-310]